MLVDAGGETGHPLFPVVKRQVSTFAHSVSCNILAQPSPLPSFPIHRTPEELLTQKLWRLRVKFLFSSTAISAVRIQALSLSFEKLTRRGSSGKVSNSRSGGGGGNILYRNDMTSLAGGGGGGGIGGMPRTVAPMLYRGPGSTSTTTTTTASMTTTPPGTCTPCSVSVYGDGDVVSELSEEASTRSLGSRTPDSISRGSSGSISSGGGSRRRATPSSPDREAIRGLMEAIDQVISQGGNSSVLVDELSWLKERLADDLLQRSSEQHLNAIIARTSTIIQSILR